ncbi:MAG: Plug domain-containing protein, partial [Acidobacteriaceae bacterium]|nr:Plug domain-containing protein [Acidobacteriaceae bacterium]
VVTSANVQLEIGNISQTVTVEAEAAGVQTESGELSHSIGAQDVRNLPLPTGTLNPIALVVTEPGAVTVASRDNFTNGFAFSSMASAHGDNNFLIDGFDNNDNGISGQALQPSNLEAFKEVTLLTNSYSAEFGRGGASLTNVITNNGTNSWHGSAWDRYGAAALSSIPVELKNQGGQSLAAVCRECFRVFSRRAYREGQAVRVWQSAVGPSKRGRIGQPNHGPHRRRCFFAPGHRRCLSQCGSAGQFARGTHCFAVHRQY